MTTNTNTAIVETTTNETAATTYNKEELLAKYGSKSGVIRFLASEGMKRGDIAKFLDIRYQHVRNVLITPTKKALTA